MTHAIPGKDQNQAGFSDAAWMDVIQAVDQTYSELVAYQEQLESKNGELDGLHRFMSSVLESISDVLVVADRDGVIEQASGSLAALMGPRTPAVPGGRLQDLVAPDQQALLSERVRDVIRTRQRATFEIELQTAQGTTPLEMRVAPRLDERGKSKGAVLTGRPLGELRQAYSELAAGHRALQEAQASLVRSEKLASLGRLLAGVAHELNNPISFVYANTHALEKYASRFESYFDKVQAGASRAELVALRADLKLDRELKNLRTAISGARDGAERVRDIVEDLRRLSSEGSGEIVDFDMVATTRIAADWIARGMKSPVAIRFAGPDHLTARGRPGHVQQIVLNLVQNAIDALAGTEGPEIVIRHEQQGECVVLMVCDNGPGIAPEVASNIFDPFFTTKSVGKGTGLGLSISHKIAEEHGGRLCLTEDGPPGACFRLELPAGGHP